MNAGVSRCSSLIVSRALCPVSFFDSQCTVFSKVSLAHLRIGLLCVEKWKMPELWVVEIEFSRNDFGFAAIYFHCYSSLVQYDFLDFRHVLEGSICYRFWKFKRNRCLKKVFKNVQSDPYEKHSAPSSGQFLQSICDFYSMYEWHISVYSNTKSDFQFLNLKKNSPKKDFFESNFFEFF